VKKRKEGHIPTIMQKEGILLDREKCLSLREEGGKGERTGPVRTRKGENNSPMYANPERRGEGGRLPRSEGKRSDGVA